MLTAAEQERLIEIARALEARLRGASVPLLAGGAADIGLPRSCLETVVAYLKRHRKLDDLVRFIALLDALDQLTAQNQQNPKAQYATLRRDLQAFLPLHTLSADQWLFVLAWAARLLPGHRTTPERARNDRTAASDRPARGPRHDPGPRPPRSSTGGFGALGEALKQAGVLGSSSSSTPRR